MIVPVAAWVTGTPSEMLAARMCSKLSACWLGLSLLAVCFCVPTLSFAQGFLIETIPAERAADDPDRIVNITPAQAGETQDDDSAKTASNQWQQKTENGAWIVQCRPENQNAEDHESCRMLAIVNDDDKGSAAGKEPLPKNLTIEFTIENLKGNGASRTSAQSIGLLNMPGAILLPVGITMRVDNRQEFKLAVRSCHFDAAFLKGSNPVRCLAPFRLTGSLLSSFKAGQSVNLTWQDLSGKPQMQRVSLIGFTASYAAFKRKD